MNPTPAPYRLHGFDVSYFTAKVRTALRYKQLWYEELRADYREIKRRTGMGFIPMVITPEDETWQDSTDIYDLLEERHPDPPLFPAGPVQRMAAHLVELYTDEFALIPAMHYRWGSEEGEASSRARFSAMVGSVEIGNAAADRMAAGRIAVGACDEAAPVIEAHTRDLLDALSAHFGEHPYLLGARTTFADCALMGPLYAHLFVDLPSRRLLLETAIPVVGWIERCNAPGSDTQGEWLAEDVLAPTFRDVLAVMGQDAAPLILDGLRAFEAWCDQRPEDLQAPPRGVGQFETSLRGTPTRRMTLAYTLWLVQRTLDAYAGLAAGDRRRVDAAIAGTGWEDLLAYTPRHRLVKSGFALAFE
jgi:glutathione S-transferase